MIILGLDPGIARTGFGLVTAQPSIEYIRCGCLTTEKGLSTADRLLELASDLENLIASHYPQIAVVESVFFGKNHKTAMLTAQTRGVLLYILRKNNVTIEELTPLQIKSRLTGYGTATKQQVQAVVTDRLNLSQTPEPDDAADALAAALCHIESYSHTPLPL